MKPAKKKTLGRHDLSGAREPAGGYAIPATSLHNARLAVEAVPDPLEPKARIRVVSRVNLLGKERKLYITTDGKAGITEGAFQAGKEAEGKFEKGSRIGTGSAWRHGDRVDAATATALALERGAEAAFKMNNYLSWLVRTLGRRDARILSKILGDRKSYSDVATDEGKSGERGVWYIAHRFRDALETLSDAQAAHGKERARS